MANSRAIYDLKMSPYIKSKMVKKFICPHCGYKTDRQKRLDSHIAKCKAKPSDATLAARITVLETKVKHLLEIIEQIQKPTPIPKKLVSDIKLTNLDLMDIWPKMDNGEKSLGRGKINKLCGNDPRRLPHAIFQWCLEEHPLFVNLGEQNKMIHAAMWSRNRLLRMKKYDTMENLVKVFCEFTYTVYENYVTMKKCPQFKNYMLGNNDDFFPEHVYFGWRMKDSENFGKHSDPINLRRHNHMTKYKDVIEAKYITFIKKNIKDFTKTLQNHLRNRKQKVLTL